MDRVGSLSSATSGFIGITEPALYGVIPKYKSALWAAFFGGGIGGAVAVTLGARAFAPAMPSVLSIPVFFGEGFIGFMIGFVVTLIVTLAIAILLGLRTINQQNSLISGESNAAYLDTDTSDEKKVYEVVSPANGTLLSLSKVNDQAFASKVLGAGIAINPKDGRIVAPFNGIVTAIFKTNHVIGITSTEGVELLIHIGIDTVQLDGENFNSKVQLNQKVKQGEVLIEFDLDALKKKQYDSTIMVVVTNSKDYLEILPHQETGLIFEQEPLLTLIK